MRARSIRRVHAQSNIWSRKPFMDPSLPFYSSFKFDKESLPSALIIKEASFAFVAVSHSHSDNIWFDYYSNLIDRRTLIEQIDHRTWQFCLTEKPFLIFFPRNNRLPWPCAKFDQTLASETRFKINRSERLAGRIQSRNSHPSIELSPWSRLSDEDTA